MENATKALLIAAAVLIAIVIIALGVRLLGNSQNVAEQGEKVGKQISDTSKKSSRDIEDSLLKSQGYKFQRKDDYQETLPKTKWPFWCNQFTTEEKILLEEDKTYEISFTYEVLNITDDSQTPYWMIGMGRDNNQTFESELISRIYLQRSQGNANYELNLKNNSSAMNKYNTYKDSHKTDKVYLWFRLPSANSSIEQKYDYTIKITNFMVKYK